MGSKLPFLVPQTVERAIGGQTLKFYPISVKAIFKLAVLAKPISQAFSVLFGGEDQPNKITQRPIPGMKDPDGRLVFEITSEAVPADLVKLRQDRKAEAIEVLFKALTEGRNTLLACELICDSLRDVYTKPTMEDAQALNDEIPIESLMLYLGALAEVNQKVFTPFVEGLKPAGRNGVSPAKVAPAAATATS